MEDTLILVSSRDLAAIANVANVALPEVEDMLDNGEVSVETADRAPEAFDRIAQALDNVYGQDQWLDPEEDEE